MHCDWRQDPNQHERRFEIERAPGRCNRGRADLRYRDATARRCGLEASGSPSCRPGTKSGRIRRYLRRQHSRESVMEQTFESTAGIVYTETVVSAAPQAHAASAPYQLVIVQLESGSRLTGRVVG